MTMQHRAQERINRIVKTAWSGLVAKIVTISVSMESFNSAEVEIDNVRQKNCTHNSDIVKGQDNNFVGADYNYGEKYFPILGIVKVLAWPHRVNSCARYP